MNFREKAHAQGYAYLQTLESLVRLESPTHNKPACDALAEHLETILKAEGLEVERITQTDCGDQLIARLDAPGEKSTLILTHYDTVWPMGTLEKMPFKQDGDKVYGPGTLDMKAGIATALHALKLIRNEGLTLRGKVTWFLTSDEETGSHHSRARIESLAREHSRVFVLEPARDDGALKIGRKGVGDFYMHFMGKSAHAGNNPKDGTSAIRELAYFLFHAETLNDDAAGTSVNLTVADGGSVSNVIAEEARATIDVRVLKMSEGERVKEALHAYTPKDNRVRVTIEGGLNRPPMEPTKANLALYESAKTLGESWGMRLEGAVVGGGSDGNFTSALGIPTLDGLGSAGEGPHARHEHIRLSETLDRVALVAGLLAKPT